MARRPTSADVAREAGVSRTTVSFVLNERPDVKLPDQTRQRVFDAAERLGYQPNASARRLAGGRSHVIALVMRQSPAQVASDAGLAETLRGLAAAARAGGFRVMVEPLAPDGPHATYTALLRSQHADGLVISGPGSTTRRCSSWSMTAFRSCSRATCRACRVRAWMSTTSPVPAVRSNT